MSASQDHTCLERRKWEIIEKYCFPTIIDAIALDTGENVFFASGRNCKIYVAALNAESLLNSNKVFTCLAYGISGNYLISRLEDGVFEFGMLELIIFFACSKMQKVQ
ncbi:protein ROOT INITIATION DEFECTIVE 3-like isoform X2 [Pyrus x bretschneideri]|uniref:protein ROOT INITIATION DEFECTIVE 3-like isoform X2 n=1 Tax=Pyrus x bretschneideri TaxID=225117 RepID=UPI00202FA72A|nr:protein ROOT INITIATION DEFECTIVE 3-like isoform X2 [Pyrus x bretschneideri]